MEKFKDYLSKIEINEELTAKLENHFNFYVNHLSIEIDGILISEYINKDGNRIYENAIFYNATHIMEVKNFNSKFDYDKDPFEITSWNFIKTNYDDLAEPKDESRCFLNFSLINGRSGEIKGSKLNCLEIANFIKILEGKMK